MKTKLSVFFTILFLATIDSNAQSGYTRLAETTVIENPDGTATLTATVLGDLSEYSGDNYVKVSGGKFSTEMISVVTEVSTSSGISVMVVKVNYPINKEKEADLNPSKVEVYLGLKNVPGLLRRADPVYSDARSEQVNALFDEDMDVLMNNED